VRRPASPISGLLRGVRFLGGAASTQSIIRSAKSGTIRLVETRRHIGTKLGLDFLRQRSSSTNTPFHPH